ncbi:isoprenyl transferase [candidate division KSB1 bacterium]|nr:isoprenyl transferase [candidate division KSB1 bacterium]NIR70070.1 isoprenyl transferase [candidate division KSB1 bacterium]NIS27508.1 isoprenyl transferase [candidate division KSB1 bacterium]NIT74357.1 isoprenyl transferase [candidate division KSB1 bacterium]NIU28226.1 isoprenyl transferase [candidate division KSB1 bacterium]
MDEEGLKQRIIQQGNIPKHIAIIMDGNGRWACKRQLSRVDGHREGINSVREIVRASGELDIQYLTLYTFSLENWKRPRGEVSALMRLLLRTVRAEVNELKKNNVRLMVIGRLDDLPGGARRAMKKAMEMLKDNTGLTLNLALSYGGRREITDAVQNIAHKVKSGQIDPDDIDEDVIAQHLYTASMPEPELLIRTSGELRVSNFLLWQLAYTEIYVTDVLWPDFRRFEFFRAIAAYQNRERRFGRVSEQLHQGQMFLKTA